MNKLALVLNNPQRLICHKTKQRCPWCNSYCRMKWTRWHEFKSRTRLIAFHIALIPLGKVWIQLFSLQLWVNSRTDWVLQPWGGNLSRRRKNSEFKPVKLRLKIDLVSYPARAGGGVNRIIEMHGKLAKTRLSVISRYCKHYWEGIEM